MKKIKNQLLLSSVYISILPLRSKKKRTLNDQFQVNIGRKNTVFNQHHSELIQVYWWMTTHFSGNKRTRNQIPFLKVLESTLAPTFRLFYHSPILMVHFFFAYFNFNFNFSSVLATRHDKLLCKHLLSGRWCKHLHYKENQRDALTHKCISMCVA